MPRWRARLLVVLLAVPLTAPAATSGQGVAPTPEEHALELWISAIRGHSPGTLDERDRELMIWPWRRVQDVMGVLARRPGTDAALLLRAASLYSDIAVFIPVTERPVYPGTTRGMLVNDGRPAGTAWLDSHLQLGQRLVERAVARPDATDETREYASAWYVAVAAVLAGRLHLADLQPHLREARDALPDDPSILFAAGCMAETFAAPVVQATLPQDVPASKSRVLEHLQGLRFSRDANLREAERTFRRVLEIAPEKTEARVRLGHVLTLRGRADEAATVLGQVRDDDGADPVVRYYRALFLGRALELTGRAADGRASYERAAALFPRAQSPRLALSQLAAEAGDSRTSRDAVAAVLALPFEEQARADPWWVYYFGPGRNAEAIYAAASDRIRKWSSAGRPQ